MFLDILGNYPISPKTELKLMNEFPCSGSELKAAIWPNRYFLSENCVVFC